VPVHQPMHPVPMQAVPMQQVPLQPVLVHPVPVHQMPVHPAPVHPVPVHAMPVHAAPVHTMPEHPVPHPGPHPGPPPAPVGSGREQGMYAEQEQHGFMEQPGAYMEQQGGYESNEYNIDQSYADEQRAILQLDQLLMSQAAGGREGRPNVARSGAASQARDGRDVDGMANEPHIGVYSAGDEHEEDADNEEWPPLAQVGQPMPQPIQDPVLRPLTKAMVRGREKGESSLTAPRPSMPPPPPGGQYPAPGQLRADGQLAASQKVAAPPPPGLAPPPPPEPPLEAGPSNLGAYISWGGTRENDIMNVLLDLERQGILPKMREVEQYKQAHEDVEHPTGSTTCPNGIDEK